MRSGRVARWLISFARIWIDNHNTWWLCGRLYVDSPPFAVHMFLFRVPVVAFPPASRTRNNSFNRDHHGMSAAGCLPCLRARRPHVLGAVCSRETTRTLQHRAQYFRPLPFFSLHSSSYSSLAPLRALISTRIVLSLVQKLQRCLMDRHGTSQMWRLQ